MADAETDDGAEATNDHAETRQRVRSDLAWLSASASYARHYRPLYSLHTSKPLFATGAIHQEHFGGKLMQRSPLFKKFCLKKSTENVWIRDSSRKDHFTAAVARPAQRWQSIAGGSSSLCEPLVLVCTRSVPFSFQVSSSSRAPICWKF